MTDLLSRLEFLSATDGLKHIDRANRVMDGSRQETVAEHSWHVTLLAILFADAAPVGTDLNRVRDLLTIHDLVEVYAGDTVIWDNIPDADVADRETAAAMQLFALLPEQQRARFDDLWREFDRRATVEARFARALDALHPMIMSWGPQGVGHPNPALRPKMVLARKRPLIEAFPDLWELAQWLVQSAAARGLIEWDEKDVASDQA